MATRNKTKHRIASRRYELDKHLTGDLEGAHIVMGSITGHELIRLRSGEMTEGDSITLIASKVIEHDLDTDDLLALDYAVLLSISEAWSATMKDAAVPPVKGDS